MKRRYDLRRKPFVAKPGDLVLLSVRSHPAFGDVRKLRLKYTGPYVVKRRIHPNAYELEGLPPTVPSTQNVSHLRLFFPSPPKFETRPQPAAAVGPLEFKNHLEWEVEAIIQHRNQRISYSVPYQMEGPRGKIVATGVPTSALCRNATGVPT